MANNCLVKELMADFNNDNLPRFGEVVLTLKSTASNTRTNFYGSVPFTMRIEGDGVFTNSSYTSEGSKTAESLEDAGIYRVYAFLKNVSNGDKIIISDKYTLTRIDYNGDANRFDSLLNLTYLPQFTTLRLSGNDKAVVNIETLTVANAVLELLRLLYDNNASGSVEKAVENMLSAGRTSGTCTINAFNTEITVNGSSDWNKNYDLRTKSMVITFNSATSVTVAFNDATIATYTNGTWSYPS